MQSYYNYEKLLEDALRKIPKKTKKKSRFEIPKADVMISGKRTFIQNFGQITSMLNREPRILLKFLLRELAAPGVLEGNVAVIQGEFSKRQIDALIKRFVKIYVICPVCGSPDTFLVKERKIYYILCAACGAKSPVTVPL